jgi:hypothetical protein
LLLVEVTTPRSLLVRLTVAPAMIEPLASVTRPVMEPVAVCADSGAASPRLRNKLAMDLPERTRLIPTSFLGFDFAAVSDRLLD